MSQLLSFLHDKEFALLANKKSTDDHVILFHYSFWTSRCVLILRFFFVRVLHFPKMLLIKEESGSQQFLDDLRHYKEFSRHAKLTVLNLQIQIRGLSDSSDSGLPMGTETDGTMSNFVESTLFLEGPKPPEIPEKSKAPTKNPQPLVNQRGQTRLSEPSSSLKEFSSRVQASSFAVDYKSLL